MPAPFTKRYLLHDGGCVFRPAEVVRAGHITPQMIRVTFAGPELGRMTSLGADDDIRIRFPEDFCDTPLPPVVQFDPFRLIYPDDAPPSQIRADTVRWLDQAAGELDVDVALHVDGIATRWAAQATPGQRVTIGGPRGSTVLDGDVASYLVKGDTTALPAIGRFLESLPDGTEATLVAVVDGPDEQQHWATAPGVTLTTHWVYRHGALPGYTNLLEETVRTLPPPDERCFIFAAGESATMRRLRRQLVADWDVDRTQLSVAGYWKRPDDEAPSCIETEDDQR